jgi:hypothetical protein
MPSIWTLSSWGSTSKAASRFINSSCTLPRLSMQSLQASALDRPNWIRMRIRKKNQTVCSAC